MDRRTVGQRAADGTAGGCGCMVGGGLTWAIGGLVVGLRYGSAPVPVDQAFLIVIVTIATGVGTSWLFVLLVRRATGRDTTSTTARSYPVPAFVTIAAGWLGAGWLGLGLGLLAAAITGALAARALDR
jgi:hypothetical protein